MTLPSLPFPPVRMTFLSFQIPQHTETKRSARPRSTSSIIRSFSIISQKTPVRLNIKRKRELTRVPHFLGISTKPEDMEDVFRQVPAKSTATIYHNVPLPQRLFGSQNMSSCLPSKMLDFLRKVHSPQPLPNVLPNVQSLARTELYQLSF